MTLVSLTGVEIGSRALNQAGGLLIELGIVAALAPVKNFRDRHGRHRDAIGSPLGFEPVPRSLPDHEIDEFEPLGIVDRFSQQFLVALVVVARFLLTHGTPRIRASQAIIVDQRLHARNGFARVLPMPRALTLKCCRKDPAFGVKDERAPAAEAMIAF